MFLPLGTRQLLRQLGVPIWKLRKQSYSNTVVKSDENKAYFYYDATSDFFVSAQPSQSIDCLIMGAFGTITKNEPINILTDEHGALLRNMLKAADLLAYDLFFMDVEIAQPIQNEEFSMRRADVYTNSLFDQLRLISPKVIYAMGQVTGGLTIKSETSASSERREFQFLEELNIPVLFSFELSHLLEEGQKKQKAWLDLIYLTEILRKHS